MGTGVCVFVLQRYFHRHQTAKHIYPKSKQNFIISQEAVVNLFLCGTGSRRQPQGVQPFRGPQDLQVPSSSHIEALRGPYMFPSHKQAALVSGISGLCNPLHI